MAHRLPMCLDPELLKLPTEPLPTLRERRRSARECLVKAKAGRDKFTRIARDPLLSQRAVEFAEYFAKMYRVEIILLEKSIAYLGEPDSRLDLYRIFRVKLPPT
jgi:hypothetical protein